MADLASLARTLRRNALLPPSDEERKLAAWAKAAEVPGHANFRIDCDLRFIRWEDYGQLSEYGWEIDHIVQIGIGGSDDLFNLRARHRRGNRSAGGFLGNALNSVRGRDR